MNLRTSHYLSKRLSRNIALIAILSLLPQTAAFANQRIISAGGAVTEIIQALGASDQLVAIDLTSIQPTQTKLPVVGYHRQLSSEGILALNPSRIIGSDEMGPASTLQTLQQAGVEVDVVNSHSDINGLLTRINQIAQLTNTQAKAQQLEQQVQQQVSLLQQKNAQQREQHKNSPAKKVLFLLIHQGRAANVAGNHTTPNTIITLAGALNPAAQTLESYKPISSEAMIKMQPDVILVSGRSFDKLGGAEAILQKMPLLAATPAGQSKSIFTIDGHALVGGLGLKSLSEAQRIQSLIYP
ncbi:ABC transporter substrate-binding protein [Vibrio sp. S11_S32]|uniref:heme/hemin ABC transporter substrate-binding protein n=1 Tax=Vibrio sp. S11_S32 TaxID=2720225 RepID=UPI0016812180|nr:ABC transporter substrate-binding protein [Vibrio sp. S11_S32]MBD1576626.1 ABC transporter substrate-binding protein [Vibrio sp. S11_S32]